MFHHLHYIHINSVLGVCPLPHCTISTSTYMYIYVHTRNGGLIRNSVLFKSWKCSLSAPQGSGYAVCMRPLMLDIGIEGVRTYVCLCMQRP